VPPAADGVSRRAQIHAVVAQQAWKETPILVEALSHADPEVRKEAAVGLSLLDDAPFVEALEPVQHGRSGQRRPDRREHRRALREHVGEQRLRDSLRCFGAFGPLHLLNASRKPTCHRVDAGSPRPFHF